VTVTRRGPVLVVLAALALAGCTSSTVAADDNSPVAVTTPATPTAPSTPVVASTPPSAAPSTTAAAPTTTTAAPRTTASRPTVRPSPVVPRSTCTDVSVRVIRGSASVGQEIAALQFTNAARKTCTLVGYPQVTLMRGGKIIGTPSQPTATGSSTRVLAAGAVAESLLHDYTSCQAPLSDMVRVVVPGSSFTAIRPAQLRACVLRVDRLGPPE
jgi:Protein of unknown function (DUF4232)